MFCEHSFISEVNGYRYCGDPEVHKASGYHPYCPDNQNNAFRCPKGFVSKTKVNPQSRLDDFFKIEVAKGEVRQ